MGFVEGQSNKFSGKKPSEIPNLKEKFCYNELLVKSIAYVSKANCERNLRKDVKTVHDGVLKESQKYLKHRFQIENERYHWKIILH